ncbi:MAG: zf-TFIIB domain-containing protein [Planctomycetota bacterium]
MSQPSACPKCRSGLLHVERRGLVVELCPGCRGQWLDPGELTVLVEVYRKLAARQGAGAGVFCVRCGDVELRELCFPGTQVAIDVCPQCEGVWLDAGELELVQRAVATLVARDEPDLARRAVELLGEAERAGEQRFRCPKCQHKLWHLDRAGNVVELCSGCRGMWFDTGELTVLLGVYRRLEAARGAATGLLCLRCGGELRELPYPGTEVAIDVCAACQGVWLDRGEFEELERRLEDLAPEEGPEFAERARVLFDALDRGAAQRAACPKCGGSLAAEQCEGVRAEFCQGCRGTWLDSGDLTRVVGVSRRIKLGGEVATELSCVRCPDQRLVELPYPGTAVAIDLCPDCRGVWLDAGEVAALRAAVQG